MPWVRATEGRREREDWDGSKQQRQGEWTMRLQKLQRLQVLRCVERKAAAQV